MKNFIEIFNKFKGVDAVVLTAPSNTFYLAEYESSFAYIVLSKQGGFYLTDTRYIEEASAIINNGAEVLPITYKNAFSTINEILDKLGAKNIGFENLSMSFETYTGLKSALIGKNLIGIEQQLLAIRSIKTADELKLIKKAAKINDKSFDQLCKKISLGVTERELAYELEYLFRKNGADGTAFETIVAFGDNTSKPHAHAGDKKLTEETPITIDFGCKLNGYCSDITRNAFFGSPTPKYVEIYEAVLQANMRGIDAIMPNVATAAIHSVCLTSLAEQGLDKYFIHGTGHGVGIDIHEAPTLNANSAEILKRNMVVTVEPGVYIPGFGGVRIEDLIIVTSKGAEIISHTDKKLLIL